MAGAEAKGLAPAWAGYPGVLPTPGPAGAIRRIQVYPFGGLIENPSQLQSLNSATKYPSIPTYHELNSKGKATDVLAVKFPEDKEVWLTEKVDGTNARIIVFPTGQYIIGGREELLYASGDLLHLTTMRIAETLRDHREWGRCCSFDGTELVVFYVEVYGAGIQKAGCNYAGKVDVRSCRLFDEMRLPLDEARALVIKPPSEVSAWREQGGQRFSSYRALARPRMPVRSVPTIGQVLGRDCPSTVAETREFLRQHVTKTRCPLVPDDVAGPAEGLVLRTDDRSVIAKVKFENYS